MRPTYILLAAVLSTAGCSFLASLFPPQQEVQWPTPQELDALEPVSANINGEAALAAATAIQETIHLWEGRGLFKDCPTPAAGLRASVFSWNGNYYVIVAPQFDRCKKGSFYAFDWGESFAVSPEGRLLGRHPNGY